MSLEADKVLLSQCLPLWAVSLPACHIIGCNRCNRTREDRNPGVSIADALQQVLPQGHVCSLCLYDAEPGADVADVKLIAEFGTSSHGRLERC